MANKNPTEREVYDYLTDVLGFSHADTAAIMGNLVHENAAVGKRGFSTTRTGDNGKAIGLAQWAGSRRSALESMKDWQDYRVQLDFLAKELKQKAYRTALNGKTVAEKTRQFSKVFERPRIPHYASRLAIADRVDGMNFRGTRFAQLPEDVPVPTPRSKASETKIAGLPSGPMATQASMDGWFSDMLDALGIGPEVQDGKANLEPQGRLAGKAATTTAAMQSVFNDLTSQYGPLSVNSGKRSREHNEKVGGAKGSQHLSGKAMDISIAGMSKDMVDSILSDLAADPRVGGLGLYGTHIHADVRPWSGKPSDKAGWGKTPSQRARVERALANAASFPSYMTAAIPSKRPTAPETQTRIASVVPGLPPSMTRGVSEIERAIEEAVPPADFEARIDDAWDIAGEPAGNPFGERVADAWGIAMQPQPAMPSPPSPAPAPQQDFSGRVASAWDAASQPSGITPVPTPAPQPPGIPTPTQRPEYDPFGDRVASAWDAATQSVQPVEPFSEGGKRFQSKLESGWTPSDGRKAEGWGMNPTVAGAWAGPGAGMPEDDEGYDPWSGMREADDGIETYEAETPEAAFAGGGGGGGGWGKGPVSIHAVKPTASVVGVGKEEGTETEAGLDTAGKTFGPPAPAGYGRLGYDDLDAPEPGAVTPGVKTATVERVAPPTSGNTFAKPFGKSDMPGGIPLAPTPVGPKSGFIPNPGRVGVRPDILTPEDYEEYERANPAMSKERLEAIERDLAADDKPALPGFLGAFGALGRSIADALKSGGPFGPGRGVDWGDAMADGGRHGVVSGTGWGAYQAPGADHSSFGLTSKGPGADGGPLPGLSLYDADMDGGSDGPGSKN